MSLKILRLLQIMDDFILEIPNVLPKELCESITKRFENDPRKNTLNVDKKNKELMFTDLEGWFDINTFFSNKTNKVIEEYMRLLKDNPDYDKEITNSKNVYNTGFCIQRIDKGSCYNGNSPEKRFVQVIFYLNTLEEDQGGYIEFTNGRKIKPEIGKVLIYPCSSKFSHTKNEVKHGFKYICKISIAFN